MNPLVLLLGLLGLFAVGSGRAEAATPATTEDEDTPVLTSDQTTADHDTHDDHMIDEVSTTSTEPSQTGTAYIDIMEFGIFHGTSSHTHVESLEGGRTPITTEALEAFNGLRDFLGLEAVDLETIGEWAFANELTNNEEAYNDDIPGVGLYYSMQGAKVGWIADDAFDPQILADIQRTARMGEVDDVMQMVDVYGLDGFADYLDDNGLVDTFVNTLKMEPHYGGWMHGRVHGGLEFEDASGQVVATAHDLNHLTVLSHDQLQPFMNDTFDWPQWPALDTPQADVANYYQSMVLLGDPHGEGIGPDGSIQAYMIGDMDGETLLALLKTGEIQEDQAYTTTEDDVEADIF